jgi:hypothetical protein
MTVGCSLSLVSEETKKSQVSAAPAEEQSEIQKLLCSYLRGDFDVAVLRVRRFPKAPRPSPMDQWTSEQLRPEELAMTSEQESITDSELSDDEFSDDEFSEGKCD